MNSRFIKNFSKYRFLFYEMVKKDIKIKYRSSVLGLFWTLLEPLLTMVVLNLVFGQMFGRDMPKYDFPVYVLSGRLLYSFFSNATKQAQKSIRRNAGMLRKIYVPKYIYPSASCVSGFVTFLISLIVLLVVMVVKSVPITLFILQAGLPLFVLLVMVIGLGLLLATLDVFFKDMEYIWNVAVMLIMYLSAIFYDGEAFVASQPYGMLLRYNPLYGVIANFRHCVFGEPIDAFYLVYTSIVAAVLLITGLVVFYKKQDQFVLYV
jgi:ABC-2 type transport system permease protein